MHLYTFEIVKYTGRRPKVAYIYAKTTVEACSIFDNKHVGFFDRINVFLEKVLITGKDTTRKGQWTWSY